jgi:hypothetical protein
MKCPQLLIPLRNLVCWYPFLAAMTLLMLLVVWGLVLNEFGAFYLFWHEDWWGALLSGAALSLLFGEICLLVRVIDGYRALPAQPDAISPEAPPDPAAACTGPARPSGSEVAPDGAYFFTWLIFLLASWIPLFTHLESRLSQVPNNVPRDIQAAPGVVEPPTDPAATQPDCSAPPPAAEKFWSFDPQRLWFVAGGLVFFLVVWGLYRHEGDDPSQKGIAARTRQLERRAFRQRQRILILYGVLFALNCLSGDTASYAAWFVPALSVCILFSVYVGLYGYAQTRFGAYWFYPAVLWLPILVVVAKDSFDKLLDKFQIARPTWMGYTLWIGLGLGLIVLVAGLLRKWQPRARYYWVPAIALTLVGFAVQDPFEYRIRGLEPWFNRPRSERPNLEEYETLRTKKVPGLLDDDDVLNQWRRQQGSLGGKPPKLVIACVSGGASKSALFTAGVLFSLEQNLPGFGRELRLVCGASGGMVGAAVFVAYLKQVREWQEQGLSDDELQKRKKELAEGLMKALADDHLSPLMHRWMFHDLPIYLLAPHTYADRSQVLEDDLNSALKKAPNAGPVLDQGFGDLRALEGQGRLPSLVFSPMTVEDGRRVLISNLDLHYMTETLLDPGKGTDKSTRLSTSALELFKLFPEAGSFKLGTAARLNAAFPYFSPACELPTRPRRHLVDAGYYDNYGISVAAAWVDQHREWLANIDNTYGVVVLQIRAFANECERRRWVGDAELLHPEASHEPAFQGYTAPLQGALSARRASMFFRNDEQLRNLGLLLNSDADTPYFFDSVVIECPAETALNWYLTRNDVAKIRELPEFLALVAERLEPYRPDVLDFAPKTAIEKVPLGNATPAVRAALSPAAEAVYKLRPTAPPPVGATVPKKEPLPSKNE